MLPTAGHHVVQALNAALILCRRYRLDNCTSQTLHLRQKGCQEASDVLRPHSALHYAWDEPSLPHELLLELPGRRRLGCFALDKVTLHPGRHSLC